MYKALFITFISLLNLSVANAEDDMTNYCIKEDSSAWIINSILINMHKNSQTISGYNPSFNPVIELTQDFKFEANPLKVSNKPIQFVQSTGNCYIDLKITFHQNLKKNVTIKKGYRFVYLNPIQFSAYNTEAFTIFDDKNKIKFVLDYGPSCTGGDLAKYLKSIGIRFDVFAPASAPECKIPTEEEVITSDILEVETRASSSVGV